MKITAQLLKGLLVATIGLGLMAPALGEQAPDEDTQPSFSAPEPEEGKAPPEKYYGSELCAYSGFNCIQVPPGSTWAKLFPDKREREIVKRLNRTSAALRHRTWIIVPTNLDKLTIMDISPFPNKLENTDGKTKTILVNLRLQAFGAYNENGKLIHWGPVSGGRGWCDDVKHVCKTVTGEFKVYRKQGQDCISSQFPVETAGGAPMPFCMHFYQGYALHGSILPGFNASHGCVRLFNDDAKWLNEHFLQVGSKVIVSD